MVIVLTNYFIPQITLFVKALRKTFRGSSEFAEVEGRVGRPVIRCGVRAIDLLRPGGRRLSETHSAVRLHTLAAHALLHNPRALVGQVFTVSHTNRDLVDNTGKV